MLTLAGIRFILLKKATLDRIKGDHIHFASAMTMTGNNEEILRDKLASYLDLSLFIQNHGRNIKEDLTELWRRIVFNIAISNTDDHLRNHGFIIENGQWRFSPPFPLGYFLLSHLVFCQSFILPAPAIIEISFFKRFLFASFFMPLVIPMDRDNLATIFHVLRPKPYALSTHAS